MSTNEYDEKVTAAEIELNDLMREVAGPVAQGAASTTFAGLDYAQGLCHALACHSGWWTDLATGERKTLEQVNIPEKLMLIVSEVSEAMEGHRKDLMDDKLPHRKMLEVELADALTR